METVASGTDSLLVCRIASYIVFVLLMRPDLVAFVRRAPPRINTFSTTLPSPSTTSSFKPCAPFDRSIDRSEGKKKRKGEEMTKIEESIRGIRRIGPDSSHTIEKSTEESTTTLVLPLPANPPSPFRSSLPLRFQFITRICKYVYFR